MKRASTRADGPLLTVCIITYNHEQYIAQAIDSFLTQQADFAWQLVIADDCSTDRTREILRAYKRRYPELIHLILQEKNVGPEGNWLDLIDYPKTRYVLYAEGDDYLTDPTKLQRQVDFLESHPDFALCFHPVEVVYEDGSRAAETFPSPAQRHHKTVLGLNDLLLANFIQTNSVMYRWRFTDASIKDIYPRGVAPGDWYLHLLHAATGKIGFVNRTMAVYRRHPGGIWWDADKDVNVIWRKYGVAHVKLYMHMLQFDGVSTKARASILDRLRQLFEAFCEIDRQEDGFLRASIAQVPEATALFIHGAVQERTELLAKQWQLERDNDAAHASLEELTERTLAAERLLQAIRTSRLWKLRNTFARLFGKSQI